MKNIKLIFLSIFIFTFHPGNSVKYCDHFSNSLCENQIADFSTNCVLPPIDTLRIVPEIPPSGKKIRLLIDSDAANEIDDLYAIALALNAPDRFTIVGFVATHFAASAGPGSTEASYSLILKLLENAGVSGKYAVKRGANPMQYFGYPSEGEGVDFIIEQARKSAKDDPLWLVCLGAATNIASAIMKDPEIIPKIRVVFHSRSSQSWPERSEQYNVMGDILAARTLLKSKVPLVWFDTGTNLCISFDETEKHIASTGNLGRFIHDFRKKSPKWMSTEKGFYDLGDIAFLLKPDLCSSEVVNAPSMKQNMFFDQSKINGNMIRVYQIKNEETWQLMFEKMKKYSNTINK